MGALIYEWRNPALEVVALEAEGIAADGTPRAYRPKPTEDDPDPKHAKRVSLSKGIGAAGFVVRLPRPGGKLHVCEGAIDALSVDALGLATPIDGIIGAHGCAGLPKLAPWCSYSDVRIYPHHMDADDVGEAEADKLAGMLGGRGTVVRSKHSEGHDLNDELRKIAPARGDAGRSSVVWIKGTDIVPRAVDWLLRDRLAHGEIALINGDPGDGKSLAMITIAAGVTAGHLIPSGTSAFTVGDVAWIGHESEDRADTTIIPRFMAAAGNLERLHVLDAKTDADLAAVCRSCAETVKPKLAVIDSWAAWSEVDNNQGHEVRQRLRALQPLRDANVAIGVVVHARKPGTPSAAGAAPDKGVHRVSGTAQLPAGARIGIDLKPGVLFTAKNNLGRSGSKTAIGFEIVEVTVETAGGRLEAPRIIWLSGPPPDAATPDDGPSENDVCEWIETQEDPPSANGISCHFNGPKPGAAQGKRMGSLLGRAVSMGRLAVVPKPRSNGGYILSPPVRLSPPADRRTGQSAGPPPVLEADRTGGLTEQASPPPAPADSNGSPEESKLPPTGGGGDREGGAATTTPATTTPATAPVAPAQQVTTNQPKGGSMPNTPSTPEAPPAAAVTVAETRQGSNPEGGDTDGGDWQDGVRHDRLPLTTAEVNEWIDDGYPRLLDTPGIPPNFGEQVELPNRVLYFRGLGDAERVSERAREQIMMRPRRRRHLKALVSKREMVGEDRRWWV